jgi:hypothetical protein
VSCTITNFSGLININFPYFGENNDTQGFRTNFSEFLVLHLVLRLTK